MAVSIDVRHGDCLQIIPQLVAEGRLVDAVCCDPPYHLVAVKRWGNETKIAANPDLKGNGMHRFVKGFMGAAWDGGDVAFRPETWQTVSSIMRPGAFLLAFGGTRTYHRLTCAIEDAGFVIQDCLMFMFATGFPKRRDMLKPAYEPIVLAYKPGGKRTMQIDECRIPTEDGKPAWHYPNGPGGNLEQNILSGLGRRHGRELTAPAAGRWPANCVHDNSDEVVAAFPESAGSPAGEFRRNASRGYQSGVNLASRKDELAGVGYGDGGGSAARFFFSSKADKTDRWGSRHPTVKPVELMKWLVALVCPPGGTVLDCFAGSGTTGVAALATGRNAILIEREAQYHEDIKQRLAFYEGGGAHSVQAKNRNRKTDHGPLFAEPPFDEALDCKLSFDAAIQAIGERVKAGEPLPTGGYFGGEE